MVPNDPLVKFKNSSPHSITVGICVKNNLTPENQVGHC